MKPVAYLGVDLGEYHYVATSDGLISYGNAHYNYRLRAKKGGQYVDLRDRSTKRQERGKHTFEYSWLKGFARQVVRSASQTNRGIALEDLRSLVKINGYMAGRAERFEALLREEIGNLFITDRPPIVKVNPAYTSQTCPQCGYVDRKNRKGRDFRCLECGRWGHSDTIGAINIAARAEKNLVHV